MKIDQLYYCLKTAETQSLTKAAELLLYIPNKIIGEMITSLENELGVKIFNRSFPKGCFDGGRGKGDRVCRRND